MANDFDNISTKRSQSSSDYIDSNQSASTLVDDDYMRPKSSYSIEDEEKYNRNTQEIISQNAKMFIIYGITFLWFVVLIILQGMGITDGKWSMVLSFPPVIVLLVAYIIYKKKNSW